MKAFGTMLKTELKLSLRGMDMFIFAICMPLVVLILLGIIYGAEPASEGADYSFLQQSFGALCSISICAGGVMGLPLVVSDYRGKKILKRFRVTPVSPALILTVQVVIYTIYSLLSLLLLYLTAALFFGYEFTGSWPQFAGGYLLVILSIFSIGMMVGSNAPHHHPDADLFRRNAALRGDAEGAADGGGCSAADPGNQDPQIRVPGPAGF